MKAAEAIELEMEVQRLRDENAELRRRTGEVSALETAKKKAEVKAEQLEAKVRPALASGRVHSTLTSRGKMEDMIQEKVAQKQNELNATYDEKMRNSEQRCVYEAGSAIRFDPDGALQGGRPTTPAVVDQESTSGVAHIERVHSGQAPRSQSTAGYVTYNCALRRTVGCTH